mgnify:CR=1 FL=1
MPADYHMHTVLCKHAEGAIEAYVEAARQKSLPEICFTDHAPAPDDYDAGNRMTVDEFPAYRDAVAGVRDSTGATVLFGIEADYYEGPGCLEFLRPWLSAQPFDLVIGSVHCLRGWGVDDPDKRAIWDSVDVTKTWQEYFALIGELADTKLFDVVAHLDLPKKFGYRPRDKAVKEMVQPTLDRIAAAGMGIEINTSGLRRPVKEIYPSPLILELAHDREIPICFGSDSHRPQEVGFAFDQALRLAKEAGYADSLRFRGRRKQIVALPGSNP